MRIDEFPRPKDDNRRGIHWSASTYHPAGSALDFWIAELQAMKIKWVKVLDDSGGSSLEVCQRLLNAEMMPIVRLYRDQPNPGTLGGREADTVKRLVAAGVRYFESNNEPDLPVEWKGGQVPPNWIDIVVDNFIADADMIIGLGGLPALPAVAVGSKADLMQAVAQRGRADIFQKGGWIAIHNYTLNHPLDYPYDPVNQTGQPVSQQEYDALGPWAWESVPRDQINQWRLSDKNPGATIMDDASCFLAFQRVDQLAREAFGFPVVLISTEGGPVVGWKEDRRYPRMTVAMQCDRVTEIAEYMQGTREINGTSCPDNYFTLCHWLLANERMGFMSPGWESQSWYTDWWNQDFGLQGELPVVAALKALPAVVPQPQGRKGRITGKVLRSDTDEPFPDLTVQLLRGTSEAGKTQTAADGSFSFTDLAAGEYDLAVPPWGVLRRGIMAAESGGSPVVLRLTGGRTSVLSGTLHSASAPAAGVGITLHKDGQPLAQTSSKADGSFRFENLTLGLYRLTLPGITIDAIGLDGWQAKSLALTTGVAPGYQYVVEKKRLLTAEETNNRHLFYGMITDALGAPLNGVKVQMTWPGVGNNPPVKVSGSDPYKPAGYYEFLHTPGTFTLQVVEGSWPSDRADGLETAHVPGREGQAITYEVSFRLQAVGAPAQVDGVISGGTAGRKVTLSPKNAGPNVPPARQTTLAANGAFAFPNPPAGAYQLALEGVGTIASDVVVAPGSLFRTLLATKSRLSGKATGAANGPVAVLHAPAAWGWTRQTPLAADGGFSFEGLPPGHYRLDIGEQKLTDLALTGENRLVLAPIDLAKGRRSVVRGRVADAAGQPKPDRNVTLKREQTLVAKTLTAADGTYRFANLPAGKYILEVTGLGTVPKEVTLDGEREVVVDVLWPNDGPRGVLQGRVLDGAGVPQLYTLVRLLKDNVELARVETDVKGAFKFTGLAAGKYSLAVGESDPTVKDVIVSDGTTVMRDVTLPGGPAKVLAHYLLFAPPPATGQPGHYETRLLLALAAHYLSGAVAGGFSLDEAKAAERVTIVGNRVPASAESTLTAAHCEVARLGGDAFAVAAALAHLFAEG